MSKHKSLRHLIPMVRCKYCRSEEDLTVDHMVPKSRGGTDHPNNLQCLCKRCNTMKSGATESEVQQIWKLAQAVDRERFLKGKRPRFASKHTSFVWKQEKDRETDP